MTDPSAAAGNRVLSGRYALRTRIGAGGAGEVWHAHDQVLQREVAVKLLHAEVAGHPDAIARFRAEATAAAKLTHPHAVMVFDIGRDGDRDYLVMELVEGASLDDVLAGSPLPADVVAALGSQLGRALGAAHARGLVHRDVKPGNVMVTAEGMAKLTDFGIARALGEATSRLTRTGDVMGTARYLAPEQLQDQPVDGRADVYALGLLLHQAVTGQLPFGDGTAVEVAMRRLSVPLPRASQLRPDVPPLLDEVIARATQLDPDQRFQDGSELAAVLARAAAPDAARVLAAGVAGQAAPATAPGAAPAPAAPVPATTPLSATAALDSAPTGSAGEPVALAPPRRPGPRRWPLALAAMIALVAIGAVLISRPAERDEPPAGGPDPEPEPIAVVDGGDHDPFGSGDEHPADVPNAFDGDPSTFWRTQQYRGNPELGGLKPGVGIWLDLGEPREIGAVVVRTTNPGADFTVYAGGEPPASGVAPDDWGAPVASVSEAGDEERIDLAEPTEARVWLFWFTSLPPDGDRYRATVSDVGFEPA